MSLAYEREEGLNYFFILSNPLVYFCGWMNFDFSNVLSGFYYKGIKVLSDLRVGIKDDGKRWLSLPKKFIIHPTHAEFLWDGVKVSLLVPEKEPALLCRVELDEGGKVIFEPRISNRRIHFRQNISFLFFRGYPSREGKEEDGFLLYNGDCITGVRTEVKAGRAELSIFSSSEMGDVRKVKNLDFDSLLSEKKNSIEKLLEKTCIETPDERLNKAIQWSKIATEMNYKETDMGKGYYAGLPRFPCFWGRDTGWILYAPLFYGEFQKVKESVQLFFNKSIGGKIPNYVSEKCDYASVDSGLLLGIISYYYYRWSGDSEFIRSNWENLRKIAEYIYKRDRDGDLLPESGFPGSVLSEAWMDFAIRWGSEIDVVGEWAFYLKCLLELSEELSLEKDERWKDTFQSVKRKINQDFWNEKRNFFYDHKRRFPLRIFGKYSPSITINCAVPILFELIEREKVDAVLERFSSPDFLTKWGIRCRSKKNWNYMGGNHSFAYHYGMVWPFTNAWIGWAAFKNHNADLGFLLLEIFKFLTETNTPGGINETVPGDFFDRSDCPLQTWSSALFFAFVVGGLCGIDCRKDAVRILPHFGEWEWLKIKKLRVGSEEISVEYRKDGKKWIAEISIEGKNQRRIELGFPEEGKVEPEVEWWIIKDKDSHVLTRFLLNPGERKVLTLWK
jgi:hypothetical protein